ncbi:MAG: glycosyltransferase family 4 protein [Planctomycetota bacterium]
MRVLHLFSDWKWTGPAEPCLDMVRALRARGVEASLAVPTLPFEAVDTVRSKATDFGVPLNEAIPLTKHFNPFKTLRAAKAVADVCLREKVEILHAHRRQDHLVGALAARKAHVPLVRSSHEGIALENEWRHRWLLPRTDLYLPVSADAGAVDARTFGLPAERWKVLPPALDTSVFTPAVRGIDLRRKLAIPDGRLLVGIVARMQRHRRFRELLESWALVAKEEPQVHFTIIGRGTHMQEVAVEPAKALGLDGRLTFAGYHRESYVEAVGMLDIVNFMVPGSDGSCRALRQALAMGKPAVTSRRGMIPEIVKDGVTGFCVEDTPENLAAAILKLVRDPGLRTTMGEEARRVALATGSLEAQGAALEGLYQKLLSV